MNNNIFTFTIPLYIRELEVTFWMRPPKIETIKSRYKINLENSYLYLQKSMKSTYGVSSDQWKSMSFPITRTNLPDIQEMCYNVLSWYTKEGKEQLYGKSDNGILMFNSEYNGMHEKVVCNSANGEIALKIVPSAIEVGNNIMQPGAIMYINKQVNTVVMPEDSIKRFCDFIIHFSFISYELFAMQCFNYCNASGNLLSEEETTELYNRQKIYNRNFRY